jgi:hypothetical protein
MNIIIIQISSFFSFMMSTWKIAYLYIGQVLPFLQAASQIVARHEDTWERKHPFIQTWVSTTHRNTRTKADTYISGAEMQIKKLYVHYSSKDYKINYLSVFHIITRWSIFLTLSSIVVLIIKFFLFFLS